MKNEIVTLLNKETSWCKRNPADVSEEYRCGFIAGLKQAKRLVEFGEIVSLESVTPIAKKGKS